MKYVYNGLSGLVSKRRKLVSKRPKTLLEGVVRAAEATLRIHDRRWADDVARGYPSGTVPFSCDWVYVYQILVKDLKALTGNTSALRRRVEQWDAAATSYYAAARRQPDDLQSDTLAPQYYPYRRLLALTDAARRIAAVYRDPGTARSILPMNCSNA